MKLHNISLVKQIISVIESIQTFNHIDGTRNYIDSYYRQHGVKSKPIIELYYNRKLNELRD